MAKFLREAGIKNKVMKCMGVGWGWSNHRGAEASGRGGGIGTHDACM